MKPHLIRTAALLAALSAVPVWCAAADKAAVVYFSRAENVVSNNVAVDGVTSASVLSDRRTPAAGFIAKTAAEILGAPVFALKVREPYPAPFDDTVSRNHSESASGESAPLVSVPDLSQADTVVLGFPIWNMALPQPVVRFLQEADLSSKRVLLFCTHDGYGSGRTLEEVRRLQPKAKVETRMLAVNSSAVDSAAARVTAWLGELGAALPSPGRITVKAEGRTFEVELNGTPEAAAFAAMLPLRVRMGEYGGREFYGALGAEIPTSSTGQYTFEDGTLTWCPTNDTVAIFYAQSAQPHLSMAVYPMGKVLGDLSLFERLSPSAVFEFSRGP